MTKPIKEDCKLSLATLFIEFGLSVMFTFLISNLAKAGPVIIDEDFKSVVINQELESAQVPGVSIYNKSFVEIYELFKKNTGKREEAIFYAIKTPHIFRVKVENKSNQRRFLLKNQIVASTSAKVWVIDESETVYHETSYGFGKNDDDYSSNSMLLGITLKKGISYLVIAENNHFSEIQFSLHDFNEGFVAARYESELAMFLFGMSSVCIIYALFIYWKLKREDYLYYLIYASSMMILNLGLSGWLKYILGIIFNPIDRYHFSYIISLLIIIAGAMVIYFLFVFPRKFIGTNQYPGKGDKIVRVTSNIFGIVMLVSVLFFLVDYSQFTTNLSLLIQRLVGLISTIFITSFSLYYWLKYANQQAKMLSIAVIMLSLGLIATIGTMTYHATNSLLIKYSLVIGSVIEMLILAAALAERLQTEIAEKLIDRHTGVYNKNYWKSFVEDCKYQSTTGAYAMIYADVNRLKFINDTYGHQAGDQLIKLCADIIKSEVGKKGLIFKDGGDEFLIFLQKIDQISAQLIIDNIKEKVSRTKLSVTT